MNKIQKNVQEKYVVCLGLMLVDILAQGLENLPSHWEETLLASSNKNAAGGGAANSAITFSRLGQKVKLLARRGNDDFGLLLEKIFHDEGVSSEWIVKDKNLSTGVAIGLVHKNGKRCFIVNRGANYGLCLKDTEIIDPDKVSVLHINGYFQFPALEKDMARLLSVFKKSGGGIVTFDTASWDPTGRWFETIQPFAQYIDIFFSNNAQLEQLTGEKDVRRAAKKLLKNGIKTVVAKLGADGCTVFTGNQEVHAEPYPVEVVDTTGAGDSFDAAYIVGLLKGWDTYKCAMFANVVGAANCTEIGATTAVPSYEEAEKLLNEFLKGEQENVACNTK